MMEEKELLEKIKKGEDSLTQFKREIIDSKELSKELVAFSNAEGGMIIFGVADNSEIVGINEKDEENLRQLVSNVSHNNIRPPIHTLVEIFILDDKKLLLVQVKKGNNKPYSTEKGIYYTKSGSDKRTMSQEELKRAFQESQNLYADEETIYDSNIEDFNNEKFLSFLRENEPKLYDDYKKEKVDIYKILENYNLLKNIEHKENERIRIERKLTLAGNLLFGLEPQKLNKLFFVDCCYFDGQDISSNKYLSKKELKGDLNSVPRNPTINNFSKKILSYNGYDSGIKRVLDIKKDIDFINDTEKELFKVIIPRDK